MQDVDYNYGGSIAITGKKWTFSVVNGKENVQDRAKISCIFTDLQEILLYPVHFPSHFGTRISTLIPVHVSTFRNTHHTHMPHINESYEYVSVWHLYKSGISGAEM